MGRKTKSQKPGPVPPRKLAKIEAATADGKRRKTVVQMGPISEVRAAFKRLVRAGRPAYSGFPVLMLVTNDSGSESHVFDDKAPEPAPEEAPTP